MQSSLSAAQKSKTNLQVNKSALLKQIESLGKLNQQLKDVTVYVGSLQTRGAKLREVIDKMVLLDAELFLVPLKQTYDLLKQSSALPLPVLPQVSAQTMGEIRKNLQAFETALPDFPLTILD